MWQRRFFWLAIVLSLSVASAGFLPAGVGPYTAVYGPASALRAQRAILLLTLATNFVSVVFVVLTAAGPEESGILDAVIPVHLLASPSPLASSLRC